jgi:hypothetical protein
MGTKCHCSKPPGMKCISHKMSCMGSKCRSSKEAQQTERWVDVPGRLKLCLVVLWVDVSSRFCFCFFVVLKVFSLINDLRCELSFYHFLGNVEILLNILLRSE